MEVVIDTVVLSDLLNAPVEYDGELIRFTFNGETPMAPAMYRAAALEALKQAVSLRL